MGVARVDRDTTGAGLLLRDDDLVLRPWHEQDADDVRPSNPVDDRLVSFVVERADTIVGVVELRCGDDGEGQLSWSVLADHRGRGTGLRAVRMLVSYAFDQLDLRRVQAYVPTSDRRSLRLAGRAGLRREGVVRGHEDRDGARADDVLLARLAEDPEPTTQPGFRAVLNAALPTKRVIAQGLLRDPAGRVLVCELVYKPDWDLPGGVVEPLESPRDCLGREIAEELGVDLAVGDLITVDWLPPWAGWDDACLLLFDLGTADARLVDTMKLQPREITAVHWADAETVATRCRPQVAERLALLDRPGSVPNFLHSGRAPS